MAKCQHYKGWVCDLIIVVPDDAPYLVANSDLKYKLRELGKLRVYNSLCKTESILLERLGKADVALTVGTGSNFTARVLKECPQLRHIAVFGIGVDNVDLETCRTLGITVTNTPDYSADVVAEKAIALALAVAHRIPRLDLAVRNGEWPHETVGQLKGKTLGVIGTGPIGQRVISLGKSFDMDVIAWTFNPSYQRAREYQVSFVTLNELVSSADVVCIQLPLTSSSLNIISHQQFALMKPSAILINVGRAAVVNEEALINALIENRILGAGLDVFAIEPLPQNSRIRKLDNVVLSPHNAANTHEANRTGLAMAIQNIYNWHEGLPTNKIV